MPLDHSPVGAIIAVSSLEAARPFYEDILGLRGEQTPGGYLLHAGDATVLYLLEVGDQAGTAGWPVASFRVDDIDAAVSDLRARGATFLADRDLPFNLNEHGIADQGEISVAWMRDPDGNLLTLFKTQVEASQPA